MSKNKISPIGESWDVFEKKIFTPEEIAASDLRVALVGSLGKRLVIAPLQSNAQVKKLKMA